MDLVKRSTSDRRRVFYIGFLGRLLFKLAAKGGEEEEFFDKADTLIDNLLNYFQLLLLLINLISCKLIKKASYRS